MLHEFMPEYGVLFTEPRRVLVEVEKIGGGTAGQAYEGTWAYRARDYEHGVTYHGSDLHTGTAKTHAQAARLVLEFVLARDEEETPRDDRFDGRPRPSIDVNPRNERGER